MTCPEGMKFRSDTNTCDWQGRVTTCGVPNSNSQWKRSLTNVLSQYQWNLPSSVTRAPPSAPVKDYLIIVSPKYEEQLFDYEQSKASDVIPDTVGYSAEKEYLPLLSGTSGKAINSNQDIDSDDFNNSEYIDDFSKEMLDDNDNDQDFKDFKEYSDNMVNDESDFFPEGEAFLDFDSPDTDKVEFRQLFKGPSNLDEVSMANEQKDNQKPLIYTYYDDNNSDVIHYVIRDNSFDSREEMTGPYSSGNGVFNSAANNNELESESANADQQQQQMSSSASFTRPQVLPSPNFEDMLYFTPDHQKEIEDAVETHVHVMHSKRRRKDRSNMSSTNNNNINNNRQPNHQQQRRQFDQPRFRDYLKPPKLPPHMSPLKMSGFPTFPVSLSKPSIMKDHEPSGSHLHPFKAISSPPDFSNNQKFRKNRRHAIPRNNKPRNFNKNNNNIRQLVGPLFRRH
jgi:hypothetical protein